MSPALKTTAGQMFLVAVLSVFFACSGNPDRNKEEPRTPGSARSLDGWYAERAFPGTEVNMGKLTDAFMAHREHAQRQSMFSGSWEAIGPKNFGGRTLCLAFNPQNSQTILAGSASGGLWVTHSAGLGANAWQPVPTGFPVLGVAAIAYNPNDSNEIYIGTGEVYNYQNTGTGYVYRLTRGTYGIGILKSVDGGVTWSKSLDWQYSDLRGVQDIIVNPLRPATLFAATTEGIYRSFDSGTNWNQVLSYKMATDLHYMPGDTTIVLAAVGNCSSANAGIYRSVNGGTTFTKITNGLPAYTGKVMLDVCSADPDEWYASVADEQSGLGVYRSSNGGLSWYQANATDFQTYQGWYSHDVSVHPDFKDEFVAGGIDMHFSGDGGASLNQTTYWYNWDFNATTVGGSEGPPDYVHADIHRIYRHPNGGDTIYVACDGGIFRSTDAGQTYEGCNGSYQTQQFYPNFACSTSDSLFAIGGMQDNATAVYEGNDGWRRVIGGDGMSTAIDPSDDNIVYGSSQYLNLDKSTDRAVSFFGLSVPGSGSYPNTVFSGPFALSPSAPNVIYAGRTMVYKSTNGGNTFNVINGGNALDGNPVMMVAVNPVTSNNVWVSTAPVVTSVAGLFYTTNGGTTWLNGSSGLPNRYYKDLAFDHQNPSTIYVVLTGFGTSHLYKSVTMGAPVWVPVGSGLPDVPTNTVTVDPFNGQIVYVGNDLGVYVSIDGGLNFQPFSDGLTDATLVFDITVSPADRKLKLATHGKGVFERDMLPVTITGIATSAFPVVSVYPNPAADYIMIDAGGEDVFSVTLYDTKGAQVVHLEEQVGKIKVSLATLPRGIYFADVLQNGVRTVRKFLKS